MNRAVKGTKDILPGESELWQELEAIFHKTLKIYGYAEARTPVMEETSLFVKNIGQETDIVNKEMFSFVDRGDRNITLRPEGTAPIMRSYIEHNLDKKGGLQKLYYVGPMFRAERPQAGRLRQFHQIGAEAIGSLHPALDAEIIALSAKLLEAAGVNGFKIKLNNLGCGEDKKKLSAMLKNIFSNDRDAKLCGDCLNRLKINPLRVLDCKNDGCRESVRSIFRKEDFICSACKEHFAKVLKFLDGLKVSYDLDPYIVRGLDYYTRTVFEITHDGLGSKDAIGAGGRYDRLSADMGGPDIGACGVALGIDRMMMVIGRTPRPSGVDVFVAAIGADVYDKAFIVLNELRDAGISCDIDYHGKSLKAQMRQADSLGSKFVLIIGEDEAARGEILLRDMSTKEQSPVRMEEAVKTISKKIKV